MCGNEAHFDRIHHSHEAKLQLIYQIQLNSITFGGSFVSQFTRADFHMKLRNKHQMYNELAMAYVFHWNDNRNMVRMIGWKFIKFGRKCN